ncbi:MAG TPA: hypothetical protein VJ021_06050 [Thermoplasmata archaeon]|nr:hypothetical protein [Thermoplasmata archaeon]
MGTLLSLLVFFALFGIFLTQYLPLWMNDNEAAFTNAAATSFIEFKSGIDTQYALGLPPTVGTAFTISSAGVPLLAQPTEGTITFLPSTCPGGFYVKGTPGGTIHNYGQPVNPAYCVFENETMSTGPGGSGHYYQKVATGVLEMQLPNRYYSYSSFYFEADGIIQSQSGGYQVMAYAPPFNVTSVSGNASVSSSFLQLTGNATSVIGQGSEEVYSHLRFSQQVSSNGKAVSTTNPTLLPFNYTFEIGTQYPCAWSNFFQSEMNVSGLSYGSGALGNPTYGVSSYNYTNPVTDVRTVPYAGSCFNAGGGTTILVVNVNSINYATMFYAGVTVTVGIGST